MDKPPVIGWIEIAPVDQQADAMTITANITALSSCKGRFELVVRRWNGSNTSNSSQNGAFAIDAPGTAKLSQTTINLDAGDTLKLELHLYADGERIHSAVLSNVTDRRI